MPGCLFLNIYTTKIFNLLKYQAYVKKTNALNKMFNNASTYYTFTPTLSPVHCIPQLAVKIQLTTTVFKFHVI